MEEQVAYLQSAALMCATHMHRLWQKMREPTYSYHTHIYSTDALMHPLQVIKEQGDEEKRLFKNFIVRLSVLLFSA